MTQAADSALPPFRELDEPPLAFDVRDPAQRDVHPLRGLLRHGPLSGDAPGRGRAAVRVATVAASDEVGRVRGFLGSLRQRHDPGERRGYLPHWPGFRDVFRLDVAPADDAAHVALPPDLLRGEPDPPAALARALDLALTRLHAVRDRFDVVVVHLPERWAAGFYGADGAFDLHDHVKAGGAVLGVPTQVLRGDSALGYHDRCSVAWRLGTALYVKAGGLPYKLAPLDGSPDAAATAFVGLAYAVRGGTAGRFVTCCSQVLDGAGGGVEFVAYDVGDAVDRDNPLLSRPDMRAVLARSLALFQHRHAGRLPARLVVHKTSAFTEDEVDGVLDACAGVRQVECVQVQASSPWRGVRLLAPPPGASVRSTPDAWPVRRGTMVPLSGRAVLLYISGNAPGVSDRGSYYQGGKSIPQPLVLTRHAGEGPLERTGRDALALSKLDWNNDALYDRVPVTIRFSQLLAGTISHAPQLPAGAYPYRLFM